MHVKEAAAAVGVHESTVRRAIHSGQLEALTLGDHGRYRVSVDALEAWLRPVDPNPKETP